MFKNMKLSTKLYTGFGVVLILLVILSVVVFFKLIGISNESQGYVTFSGHDKFMVEKEVDHLKWARKLESLFQNNLESVDLEVDHTQCGLGKFLHGEEGKKLADSDPKIAALLNDVKTPHQHLHESAKHIFDVWEKRHQGLRHLLKDRLDDHRKWAAKVSRMVIEKDPTIEVEFDHTRCAFGKFLASEQLTEYTKGFPRLKEIINEVRDPHKKLHESGLKVKKAIEKSNFNEAASIYEEETLRYLQEVENLFRDAISAEAEIEDAQAKAKAILNTETNESLGETQDKLAKLKGYLNEKSTESEEALESGVSTSQWTLCIVSITAILLGIFLSIYLARSITKPINRVIEGMTTGSEQVATASNQVSQSSQQMAEGANEQASSLEEISSSLEEMTSMTKQNADNAKQANNLAGEAQSAATNGKGAMTRMSSLSTRSRHHRMKLPKLSRPSTRSPSRRTC
jgi:methyl-accepting chemotaxis protein